MFHRRRLALVVIISLMACALTPASAAFLSAVQSVCHPVDDDHWSHDEDEKKAPTPSVQHSAALEHEHLCDEDPVPLTPDSVQLPIGWWMALSFLIVFLLCQYALHLVWRRGPRRYPPALRSHLAIGRIQV